MMVPQSRRESVGLVVIFVLITVVVVLFSFRRLMASSSPPIVFQEAPQKPAVSPSVSPPTSAVTSPSPAPAHPSVLPALPQVAVHVTGAVKKPGVVRLPLDARVEDALKAAGGAKPDANLEALNLAARVEDGAQFYFPTKKEQPKGVAEAAYAAGQSPVVSQQPELKVVASTSTSAAKPAASRGSRGGKFTTPGQGMVNINKADAAMLQKLPGIGPAMAERILAFRQENNGFQTPEDLLQVSGIGPKKFERMKPFVRVK
jgi:competence protein ComEA